MREREETRVDEEGEREGKDRKRRKVRKGRWTRKENDNGKKMSERERERENARSKKIHSKAATCHLQSFPYRRTVVMYLASQSEYEPVEGVTAYWASSIICSPGEEKREREREREREKASPRVLK